MRFGGYNAIMFLKGIVVRRWISRMTVEPGMDGQAIDIPPIFRFLR